MKPSSLVGRRTNGFRGTLPDCTVDGSGKSPVGVFWLFLHGFCCIVSLVLGFRFSRIVFYLLFSVSATTTMKTLPAVTTVDTVTGLTLADVSSLPHPPPIRNRVAVGRHGIRIRPYPHPNPEEVMRAHVLIDRVQAEQRKVYGVKDRRQTVVITPTYVRTFQTVHLTGLMHTLMLVPGDLVWVVVEAGGVSNETASLISNTGLNIVHVGFDEPMPMAWDDRHRMEARMRLQGLRVVREKRLDGIVMFCDDSNMHSLELFDEVQKVKWMGALSIGILTHPEQTENSDLDGGRGGKMEEGSNWPLPVQGPSCNSSGNLVGWHTFNSLPYLGKSASLMDDSVAVLARNLEWASFVIDSRLFRKSIDGESDEKPKWVKDLDEIDESGGDIESPLSLLKDASFVQPLGKCGRKIMLWWLRAEARADSRFPPGWIIDPPLDITVPAKRTPWPDVHSEVLSVSTGRKGIIGDRTDKRRPSKTKRTSRSKRKREQQVDLRVSGTSRKQVDKR